MFKRIVFSAFGAGLAVCVIVSAVQLFTTEPLILHAETFESAGTGDGHDHAHPVADAGAEAPGGHVHSDEEWQPSDGLERTLYTGLANLLVGVAVALMILSAMALKGEPIDARRGMLWGVAGFVAASLLPALGLPPELPGTPAAELVPRQVWWLATAIASAAALALLVFGSGWAARITGLVFLVAPHLIGAPAPPSLDADYPAVLAGEFVIASLVVSAVLWAVAGLAGGWLYARLDRLAPERAGLSAEADGTTT